MHWPVQDFSFSRQCKTIGLLGRKEKNYGLYNVYFECTTANVFIYREKTFRLPLICISGI